VKSDTAVIEGLLDTEMPALTSNMVIANAGIVTIDNLLDTEMPALTSNMVLVNAAVVTIVSDTAIIEGLLDTEMPALTSNMVIANAGIVTIDNLLDTEMPALTSNMVLVNAAVVTLVSDTAIIETQIGTAGDGLTDLGGMSAGMKAEVNVEVDGALDTAIAELSQAQPTATPTVRTALMLIYMALRNRLDTQTSGTDALEIYNDAGTKIAQKLLTDDGSDYSEAKMISGA